jgi:hypothetical protein
MDFAIPVELAELDRFIDAEIRPLETEEIRPLETEGDDGRFFDHRREFAREEIQMRRVAAELFGFTKRGRR